MWNGKIRREHIINDRNGQDQASVTAGRSCKDHIYTIEKLSTVKETEYRQIYAQIGNTGRTNKYN